MEMLLRAQHDREARTSARSYVTATRTVAQNTAKELYDMVSHLFKMNTMPLI